MSTANDYVLGIDLGVNSLGAALVDTSNRRLVWTGVRIFSPGFEGDYESGREESRARQRRLARQQRRQTDRRRRRMLNVFRILQQYRLLPCGDREMVFPALDAELGRRYPTTEVLPYFLRARALDRRLEPFELGRALYHLAQRRGFRGRVARETDAEEGGKLKERIEGLFNEIRVSGRRTLGEYFSKLNPHETRIRDHRTHRRMYEEEFSAIWSAQQPYHPDLLNDERRQVLHRALFHQRPLKSADHLIGDCELEPGEKRAPLWSRPAQHFRVLTAINNLRLVQRDGTIRPLTERERGVLISESRYKDRIPFVQVRKLLGLPTNSRFSIEEGGEKNLPGNVTSHRLFKVLGDDWLNMPPERQQELVSDLADPKRNETDEDLLRCLTDAWGLPTDVAQALIATSLPEKYASVSLKAILKVTPLLEQGLSFAEAKRQLWPEQFTEKEPLDCLPPVKEALSEVRNPAVMRALTELRKVVNGIVRRYGKPKSVHIELARDMKRTREERQRETKRNRDREKLRDEAKRELKPFCGENVSRRDIEKYLLWQECRKQCPYTGEMISLDALFGAHPRFDIEHIVPCERSLDDSFQNKTLCAATANKIKGKRTPWEAFGHTDEWPHMVERVKALGNTAKLRRFTMTETDAETLLEEFTSRQLNDTKYATRLAAKYVGLLYGIERSDNRRIITCAGAVTAFLRQKWNLNRILNDRPEKSRDDYRHHAVDAIAIAMASPSQVKALADAARRAESEGHRRFGSLADPWPGFREGARDIVLKTVVSHRPKRRRKGALHEETHYSPPEERDGKTVVRYTKPVFALTESEIQAIVDGRIREIVRSAWEAAGRDAKRLDGNWPVIETKGRRIPIKRVRCFKVEHEIQAIADGHSSRTRYVLPGDNHHMEVWAELDLLTGAPKRWMHCTVSRLEAAKRHRQGLRIVQREHGPGSKFCFSISEGDMVLCPRSVGDPPRIWYVRSVRARGDLVLSLATDARKRDEIRKTGGIWDVRLNTLMKLGARKVVVSPLGDVIEAHD